MYIIIINIKATFAFRLLSLYTASLILPQAAGSVSLLKLDFLFQVFIEFFGFDFLF